MKRILAFTLLCTVITTTYSQQHVSPRERTGRQDMKDRIESLHIAYLTEQLALTPTEAEMFWPVWHESHDAIEIVHKEIKVIMRQAESATLSNQEALDVLEEFMRKEEQVLQLRGQELESISDILGPQRTLTIPGIEKRFRLEMAKVRESRMTSPDRKATGKRDKALPKD